MRESKGTTHLRALCTACKGIAEMTVKSVNRICTSVTIVCEYCNKVDVVYKQGLKR